jgi:23S rRNA (uracil1939-C5)-methyltransferase
VGRFEDGRTVFIPRTAPGDLVEVTSLRLHARFARAEIGRLLESGPGRVEPRCPHYERDQCGGCQLQHLDGAAQVAARRAIVGDALRRIARLDQPDPPLTPTTEAWGYRSRVTLAVDARGRVGFHPMGRPEVCFSLEWCHITSPTLNRLWQDLLAVRERWPAQVQRIGLRLDRGGRLHVVFHGPVPVAEPPLDLTVDGPVSCWWQPEHGGARRIGPQTGAPGNDFPATVFEQVNPEMGDQVRGHAIAQLGSVEGAHVWDLYAGIGEATVRLAELGATVESVELDAGAVAFAEQRGPAAGVRRHAGRVEEWLGRLAPPAAVLCNPPRAGLEPTVVRGLLAVAPRTVVYVSCDPATLSRDLARLGQGGYRVGPVTAFDLFPQTAHVETVVRLERS